VNDIEKSIEMRGMRRQELVDYFTSIGGESMDAVTYKGEGWSVKIKPEIMMAFGAISIPSTILIFRTSEETLQKLIYKFRLRFLSAGG
jgi:hypothetical protein